jgi:hypothetical protein
MRNLLTAILVAIGLSGSLAHSAPAYSGQMKFEPIPANIAAEMDKQRTYISALVSKNFPGKLLTKSKEDFAILQAIVDRKLLTKRQTWELQALGVCFGDALTSYIPGLKWSLITDDYGTDPTLQFKDTTTQFNALTMISKRVENGSEIDVAYLAKSLDDFIKKDTSKFGKI